ncbi:MAG: hypothetical protein AABZ30_08105 [Myxococcota bacterium]
MTPAHERLAFVCAAALVSACRPDGDIEMHRVRSAVREYNRALQRAQFNGRPELLADAATDNELDRVATLIGALSGSGAVLDARQESSRVEAVTIAPPAAAELTTRETWWYRRVDRATGEVRLAPQRVHYRIRYHLVKLDGRWRVDRLDNLETREQPSS